MTHTIICTTDNFQLVRKNFGRLGMTTKEWQNLLLLVKQDLVPLSRRTWFLWVKRPGSYESQDLVPLSHRTWFFWVTGPGSSESQYLVLLSHRTWFLWVTGPGSSESQDLVLLSHRTWFLWVTGPGSSESQYLVSPSRSSLVLQLERRKENVLEENLKTSWILPKSISSSTKGKEVGIL